MELTSLSIHVYITIELHIRQFQLSSLSILKIHLYKCISVWHCRHWRLLASYKHMEVGFHSSAYVRHASLNR